MRDEFPIIPLTNHALSKRQSVHGVGVNDADYLISVIKCGKRLSCPIYSAWSHMMGRCYSSKCRTERPTYTGCAVDKRWHKFSAFKKWMSGQDWEGKQLDKDILVPGNKVYSPETCIFVEPYINSLLVSCASKRGIYPVGVSFEKRTKKFVAKISIKSKTKNLGRFSTVGEAFQAYKNAKSDEIKRIAASQNDSRLVEGLYRHATYYS